MKVVMVNDCSFIGETLLNSLPKDYDKIHIKRTGKLLEKTVKIAWKIFRAKGNIFHCHYLLQDCWLALKLGKHPTIGHAHGSDIRQTIKNSTLGSIVRYNLKKCDKIIVSTPNLLKTAKEYNKSSEYLPNIVNQNLFYPKACSKAEEKIRILVAAASDWNIRGSREVIEALKECESDVETTIIKCGVDIEKTIKLAEALNLEINVLPPIAHSKINRYYWKYDAIIASIGIGGTLGMVALEAIACGRPVIAHVSSEFPEYKNFPLLDVSTKDQLIKAILTLKAHSHELWEKEHSYYCKFHDSKKIVERLIKIYTDLIGLNRSD